jgi:hypothetical protein
MQDFIGIRVADPIQETRIRQRSFERVILGT